MNKLLPLVLILFAFNASIAQVTLGTSPYSQDFNSIGTSLPVGITVRAGSNATALGTVQTYSPTAVAWNNTTGAVKNFASGSDLSSTATATQQSSSLNRGLGIRQSGTLGDPGAAFVLQLANTSGLNNFKLAFKLQSLDITSTRVTTWRVDYGFGPAPTAFTAATATGTLTTGGGAFTNNIISVDFGSALDNKSNDVWIRIVTITPSTGSGNRASSAIDDLSLTYSSGTVATPSFSVNPAAIAFGNQFLGTTSASQSYTLNYANLNGSNVTLATASPFSISKSAAGPFSTSLTYTSAELSDSSTTVFSQFSPAAAGSANGTITHTGGGVSGTTTLSLTGTGVSLNPIATNDSFSGPFGNLITGNVSTNDTDPQSLALAYTKLTDPQGGTLTFNSNGTFSYQSVEGSSATQTFSYRATNTLNMSADATVTITLAEKSRLFISQYYEGGSTNKWIELTNPTNTAINTTSPQLKLGLYSVSGDAGNIVISGNPTQVMNLNFTIPAKSSVLIGNTGNGTEVSYLTASSAQQTSNSVINFNGNDGVALLDASSVIIDAFGTGINAKDVSYVRHQDDTEPSPSFVAAEWTRTSLAIVQNAIDLDDANRLGVHVQPELPACVSPVNQPSTLTFGTAGTKTIILNFIASTDAGEYLIVRSLNDSLTSVPADGTLYSTGNAIGGGVVAGRITGTSFTDTNLLPGTTFHYFIFALNNTSCDGGPKYLNSSPLSGYTATIPLPVCSAPASQPNNFRITFSNYNLIQGAFDQSNADEFLIVMSTDSILRGLPTDQTVYTTGDTLGGGIVIKRGAQTSFSRTGLGQDTKYFFFVFAVNSSCNGGPLYLTSAPLKGSKRTGILNNNTLNYYFGNLHSHSSYSDGNKDDTSKTPVDDYAFAKNSRKMDFLGISEHNHTQAGMRLANWEPGIQAAKNATTSTFVALHGMEWGVISGGGHVVVYGIDSLIGWEAGEHQIFVAKNTYTGPNGLFNVINRHGLNAIATLAHPNSSDFNNIAGTYDALADSAIVGSALESGPAFSTSLTYSDMPSSMSHLSYYNKMLSMGYHLGANLDHDNHNMTFGRHTRGRLVVIAPALTENDLLDAMKKMRFYASEDSIARISFTINDQLIGSAISGNGAPHISVSGTTTSPITNITIMHGTPGSGILPAPLASSSTGTLSWSDSTLTNLTTGYYYADITEADGSRIITSPIWYSRNDAAQTPKTPQTITFNALPSATYGDSDVDSLATSSNTTIPVVYTSSDSTIATIVANKVHIRKTGSVSITATQEGNSQFEAATPKSQTLVIMPRTVTAFANAKTKVYGAADTLLTYSNSPLVNGDTFTGSLTREAGENAGVYIISAGTLALDSNYILTVDTALFTITKKDLLVIADSKSKIYGTPNPVFTASYQGFVNGDSSSVLTQQPVLSTLAMDSSSAGTYPIIVSGATAANYAMSFVSDTLTITPASQFITFDSLITKTFGDADFALNANGGASGNPVTFTSSDSTVATINGATVHITGAGTATITASQAGNANYTDAANVSGTLIVNKAQATITLSGLNHSFDGTQKSVTTTTNPANLSGVTVTYNDSTVAPSAAGSYAVVARLTSNNYTAADATGTLVIEMVQQQQVITFAALANKRYGDADFILTATGGASGNQVTFTISDTTVAAINGATVHIIRTGTATITASQAGNANYSAAPSVAQNFTVNKGAATITISNLTHAYDGTPKSVNATTSPVNLSGVTVTYNNSTTAPSAAGSYAVVARLTNRNYTAADATGTLVIGQVQQVITFTALSNKTYGNADFVLTATGGASGNPVTFTSSDTTIATINGATVHIIKAGTTTITASQAGNVNYNAALSVTRTLTVNKAAATIALSNLSQAYNGTPKSVTVATTPSGLTGVTVTYNGSLSAPSAIGSYAVVASLNNSNYSAASVSGTLTITPSLKVQYRNASSSLTDNVGRPYLKILNAGSTAIPYSQLTARYWITPENFTGGLSMVVDYALVGISKVSMKYVSLAGPRVKALGYIEYSFTASAGSLPALGNSGEIQSHYANSDGATFNEANDYSLGSNTTYADNAMITLYHNGILVWGTEPSVEAPVVSLKAFSGAKNSNNSTISTVVELKNTGNVPVDYKDVTARYWFTSDGASPLRFGLDIAKAGYTVSGSFTSVTPVRTNANTYLELKVNTVASTLYPLASTGTIQYHITKNDKSSFNQLNDYSFQNVAMAENQKITIYYKGQLVYGTEPSSSSARVATNTEELALTEESQSSTPVVYPNPSTGNFTLEMNGDEEVGPVNVTIYTMVGKVVDTYYGESSGGFRKEYALDLKPGIYIMVINRKDKTEQIRIKID